jgi:translation initiation factor 1
MTKNEARTVWSSEAGDLRKQASGKPRASSLPPKQQTAYLHRDSKGRGGKSVTLIKTLALSEEEMKALAKTLKQICGSGGAVKDGVIEIQGEQRERIAAALSRMGYRVKIAGG